MYPGWDENAASSRPSVKMGYVFSLLDFYSLSKRADVAGILATRLLPPCCGEANRVPLKCQGLDSRPPICITKNVVSARYVCDRLQDIITQLHFNFSMVKRSNSFNQSISDPVRGIGKRARSQSTASKMAALTLLSLMNVESTDLTEECREERDRARFIQLNCVSVLDKISSDNDVSSSVTDDEDESHEDSDEMRENKFHRSRSSFVTVSQARSIAKMALTRPSLLLAPRRNITNTLPPGRPLPLPPKLPKHVVAANPRYATSRRLSKAA